ncbi:MAG: hypothetical protein M1834_008365 [Cirrosporium novae-zelandiae]|nr:MAG: hypothetical protein M1834_008365 [Cirrosporium novae-zelandiae]
METTTLRRKDTTKGPPLRILSLDGGGVRGYSMFILLQELMYRTYVETEGKAPRRDQIPKPCDYFDLIGGTGTGGLIAIMLGRLRLDIETCKEVYVRMTKRVFETDKTFAGIPFRSTLFKASKLEEAIRECVRQHTIFENEGNDSDAGNIMTPMTPPNRVHRSISKASISTTDSFSYRSPVSRPITPMRWGNPNALLEDKRENRTKTCVTAVYKGTPKNAPSAVLRSYDSRKEPSPEEHVTIWQAGRATCATALAFKPIQIGQSVFIDEGGGTYNPSPLILEEAAVNEWPNREVGVFVSIGTGKRPGGTSGRQHEWWEGFIGGGIGDFAEARRRLINKIEGCEDTHQAMLKDHLSSKGVNRDNYYRLNVEVGVGEFGMNEWNRLADISTSTRRYLSKRDVQNMVLDAATKMARIERACRRHKQAMMHPGVEPEQPLHEIPPPSNPMVVELPAEDVILPLSPHTPQYPMSPPPIFQHIAASEDKFAVLSPDQDMMPGRLSGDRYSDHDPRTSHSSVHSPRRSYEDHSGSDLPPPPPPKTPLPYPTEQGHRQQRSRHHHRQRSSNNKLPYPDEDGPPPVVNTARKPEFVGR